MKKHHYYHPGVLEFAGTAVVATLVAAGSLILARSQEALGYWTVARITGFVAYGLLSVAVALGVFLSLRVRSFTPPWLVVERLHPVLLLAAGAALVTHIAGTLLIGFPAYAAFVPFTSPFRDLGIGLGILSMYIGVVLVGSTYIMGLIGYGLWRFLHYLGFVAWVFALAHGVGTGHDSGARLVIAYYALGAVLVGAMLIFRLARHIASLRPPILEIAKAGS